MERLDAFERLISKGAAEQVAKEFTDSFQIRKTGAFRFELAASESAADALTRSLPLEMPEHEATPGAKGVLFRKVASLDNLTRNLKYFEPFRNADCTKVVTQGDSWFAFPFVAPTDVSESLARQLPVFTLGCPGDDVSDMSNGPKLADLIAAIEDTGAGIVALSGGGNELIGDDFPTVLRTPPQAMSAADFIETDQLQNKTSIVIQGFEEIIQALVAVNPNIQICAHSYDYPIPLTSKATFLGPVLSDLEIPNKYWIGICAHIIDEFDKALIALADKHRRNFFRVDLRGIAKDRSVNWADEIHLRSETAMLAADEFMAQFEKRLGKDFRRCPDARRYG